MQAKIVKLNKLQVVGAPYFGNPKEGKFSQAWHRYMQVEEFIKNVVNHQTHYGIEIYPPGFEGPAISDWYYMPGVAVADLTEVSLGLFGITLPECEYAVVTVKGGIPKIGESFQFLYGEWLPASEYEIAHPYDFELYDERFNEVSPDCELDIYVPVRLKS